MNTTFTPSKRLWLLAVFFYCGQLAFSQVKIGANPTIVNPNAILEIESNNKGLLLPRLALTATTNPYPLTAFVEGMLVYDTATNADITPGLYYCDGTKWIKVNNGSNVSTTPASDAWLLKGNDGTSPTINFIGTKDYNDLVFKTNALERLRLTKAGWLGIGTASPSAALHVKGQVVIDSLEQGDINKDSLVMVSASGRLKKIDPAQVTAMGTSVKKASIMVSISGQNSFETPAPINDPNKVMLYRNGVLINFSVAGSTTIISEIATVRGDEIKIVQIL
jgi:hypothetical protein